MINSIAKLLCLLIMVAVVPRCNQANEKKWNQLSERVAALEKYNDKREAEKKAVSDERPASPIPKIEFESYQHDLGRIDQNTVVDHTFAFSNTGEAPLVISDVRSSCGCTISQWPKDTLQVGEKGEIKVRYNSKNQKGKQNRIISVEANTYPSITRLQLAVEIKK